MFSEKYNKPIVRTKLRPGEKLLESLINVTQSLRLTVDKQEYMFIKPPYKSVMNEVEGKDYNSTINPLSKNELYVYLSNLNLI